MSIKVIGLHHANVHLQNPEQARDFYGRVLGMEADPKPVFERPNFWWQVGDSGCQIHTPSAGGNGTHFALMVEDIQEAKRTLEAEGIAFRESKAAGRAMQLFIQDPAGNQIELFQP